MTIKRIKEIEEHINYLLETYDASVKEKNHAMSAKIIKVIDYELAKLDKNEIQLKTEVLYS